MNVYWIESSYYVINVFFGRAASSLCPVGGWNPAVLNNCWFEGVPCSFRGRNSNSTWFNIYNINTRIIQTQDIFIFFPITEWTSCSQRKIRSPELCLKLERCRGPPNVNKVKQYEVVLSFKVSLFIQFSQSWKNQKAIVVLQLITCTAALTLKLFRINWRCYWGHLANKCGCCIHITTSLLLESSAPFKWSPVSALADAS